MLKESNLRDLLREKKLKATPIRLEILQIFSTSHCEPIDAIKLHKRLKKSKVNLVTIYRTLESFEKAGLLRPIDLRESSIYYELANHHHHHIICRSCGEIERLNHCDLANLTDTVLKSAKKFTAISDHTLEFFGACRKCQMKK